MLVSGLTAGGTLGHCLPASGWRSVGRHWRVAGDGEPETWEVAPGLGAGRPYPRLPRALALAQALPAHDVVAFVHEDLAQACVEPFDLRDLGPQPLVLDRQA